MPSKKKGISPNPVWSKFVKGYSKAKNISFKNALKECGGSNGEFQKWQREHEMYGGNVLDSINDFLWKYFGSPAVHAVKKRLFGRGDFDRFEGEQF